MSSTIVSGNTLGEKHRSFNKLVENAVQNSLKVLKPVCYTDLDVDNLLRIEVACRTRNIDFILETLKCKDMLYVSRTIKLSTWLITENQYSHIINPEYIHINLFPYMMLKAYNKFILNIRLHLRDEQRVDDFFNYFKDRDINKAFKWLPYCSSDLAEEIVQTYYKKIPLSVMKKFKNGSKCLYIYCNNNKYNYDNITAALNILCHKDPQRYFDMIYALVDAWYSIDKFTPKTTKRLIKKCPNRTLSDFLKLISVIHIPTLVKFFNGNEIKDTLIENSRSKTYESLYKYDKLKYFIARLPEEYKLDLIIKVFINKVEPQFTYESDLHNSTLVRCLTNMNNAYLWCELLPFDKAFTELKRYIENESNPRKRSYMLCILLSSAHKNADHIQTVLQYYIDSHIQEGVKFKTQFLQHLLREVNVLKLNLTSWNLLNCLFYSIGVYTKIDNSFPKYRERPFIIIGRKWKVYEKRQLQSDDIFVNAIILYNVINDISIPDILMTKFNFTTFKNSKNKLNDIEKEKVFEFLLPIAKNDIEETDMKDENNFDKTFENIENTLQLLSDWNRLAAYPTILNRIREFVEIHLDGSKKEDLNDLFTMCKDMKLNLIQPAKMAHVISSNCMNALKHNPQLLENEGIYKFNEKPMQRFITKLRVYWPDSLAVKFKENLKIFKQTSEDENSNIPWDLLTANEISDLIQKYLPETIDWEKDGKLKKEIVEHLYLVRPQLNLDTVLRYIDENNLARFLTPLHSLMYSINPYRISEIFLKLDDNTSRKRLTLQRHCLKIAMTRLKFDETKTLLVDTFRRSKKPSSRVLIFKMTLSLLLIAKDKEVFDYWSIISDIIDDVTENELKAPSFLTAICRYKYVPDIIMEEYYETVREMLKRVPNQCYLKEFSKNGECSLDEKVKELEKCLKIKHHGSPYWLNSYLFTARSEEVQLKRYERLFVPVIEDLETVSEKMTAILKDLYKSIDEYFIEGKNIVPVTMFADIQRRLEKKLPFYENYVLITSGRLILGYLNIIERHVNVSKDKDDVSNRIQQEFAEFCADYLDKEMEQRYASIYISYSEALKFMFNVLGKESEVGFIYAMLKHNPRVECFLAVIHDLPRKTYRTPDAMMFSEILEKMRTHESDVIKMLYSNYFIKLESL